MLRGTPSPNLNPKLQGMTVATHVDDIITRGARAATVEFWTLVAARFPVKEWNIVEFDNPVTYCAKRISKIQKCGKVWYTMDQTREIGSVPGRCWYHRGQGYYSPHAL